VRGTSSQPAHRRLAPDRILFVVVIVKGLAGSQCAAAPGKRVIFLSDITLWLSDIGASWEHIGVNFRAAKDELRQQKRGLFVPVSRRAHMILCSAAHSLTIYCTDGNVADVAPEERELVRASFEARLNADWPSYLTRVLANVQPAA
jgi:hypothetical protein